MPMPKGWKRVDISPDWLRQKYTEEQLSIPDISDLCGYSQTHVHRLLKRFDITIRTRTEGVRTQLSRCKRSESMTGKMSGENNPSYKRGYWENNGYLFTRVKGKSCQVHRIVAEKKIGRPLRDNEVVHHINGDKKDNRPENLEVMTRSEHIQLHSNNRWQEKEMVK